MPESYLVPVGKEAPSMRGIWNQIHCLVVANSHFRVNDCVLNRTHKCEINRYRHRSAVSSISHSTRPGKVIQSQGIDTLVSIKLLAPARCINIFTNIISDKNSARTYCTGLDAINHKSSLVQIMAGCRKTWNKVDPDLYRHMMYKGHSELNNSIATFHNLYLVYMHRSVYLSTEMNSTKVIWSHRVIPSSHYHCQVAWVDHQRVIQITVDTLPIPDHTALWGACIIHYNVVTMGPMASQITSLTTVYSVVYSGADQRQHQSSASLAFVQGIHREQVNSPHKGPVSGKCIHLMTSSWLWKRWTCWIRLS